MAFSDRELIARLVQCEAGGEGENRNEGSCNSTILVAPTHFHTTVHGTFHTRINEHCFYRPTPLYDQT